jgi:hypothetical protein
VLAVLQVVEVVGGRGRGGRKVRRGHGGNSLWR